MKGVDSLPTLEDIVTSTSKEVIGAVSCVDFVVAVAAVKIVVTPVTDDMVIAVAGVDRVIAAEDDDCIIAGSSGNGVVGIGAQKSRRHYNAPFLMVALS
jgi:hypothetical protein